MSASHHGDAHEDARNLELAKIMERFCDQVDGTAKREYPQGRMGHEDDGSLSMAITADPVHKTVVIRFGKPVEWLGLGPKEVNQFINLLKDKLSDLGEQPAGLHESAPPGYKCSDCTIDNEPCPACYKASWVKRHPNVGMESR